MYKKVFILIISIFITSFLVAQNSNKIYFLADHDLMVKRIAENPQIIEKLATYEASLSKQIKEQRSNHQLMNGAQTDTLIDGKRVIPVVFHIIHNNGNENISDEQVLSAIELLNLDFNKKNSDTISGEDTYAGFSARRADVAIEFRLASLDPQGNPTTAILRHEDENAFAVSYSVMAQYSWQPLNYLNIFSVGAISVEGIDEQGTIIGMSLFPPTNPLTSLFTDDPNCDGVLIRHDAIGNTGTAENLVGLGINAQNRSLTHELGHYFNLYHPFQNFTEDNIYSTLYQGLGLIDGCASSFLGEQLYGDYVDDTPPVQVASQNSNADCFVVGSRNTCTNSVPDYGDEPDMVENFMDYQWGFCTNLFTIGQLERINATLNGYRKNLWSYQNLIKTGILEGSRIEEIANKSFVSLFPNPAHDFTTLTYQCKEPAQVYIAIYDMLGREIKVLSNELNTVGTYQVVIDKNSVGNAGFYLVKVAINNQHFTKKVVFR